MMSLEHFQAVAETFVASLNEGWSLMCATQCFTSSLSKFNFPGGISPICHYACFVNPHGEDLHVVVAQHLTTQSLLVRVRSFAAGRQGHWSELGQLGGLQQQLQLALN
jgi:hypothetical protein